MADSRLTTPLLLSIAAALVTLTLKTMAYILTGSVSLLSDALESCINLLAALIAYASVRYSAKPVDAEHTYGHDKIEFFSAGLEGGLVIVAAIGIGAYAVERLIHPVPLQSLDLGLLLSVVASAINLGVAVVLLRVGRQMRSVVLVADGQHLMSDVWSSIAVVAGLGLVAFTGWEVLDPILGLLIAGGVLWTGISLVRRSFDGLMDHSWPVPDLERVRRSLIDHMPTGCSFHALRTRLAGAKHFADFHLLVPGRMSVAHAHRLGEGLEKAIQAAMPEMMLELTIHIEPIEEAGSYEDSELLRLEGDRSLMTPGP